MIPRLSNVICILLMVFASSGPVLAQQERIQIPELKGELSLGTAMKLSVPLPPVPNPNLTGDRYATVQYAIGIANNATNIQNLLTALSQIFPAKFGNSAGTYTVTITVSDLNNKQIVKQPIFSFQWSDKTQIIFLPQTVSQILQGALNGTLVNNMLVGSATTKLQISVEMNLQANRSLDFSLLQNAATAASSATLASYFPMPAATIPILNEITTLVNALYQNSQSSDIAIATQVPMIQTNSPTTAFMIINGPNNFSLKIPIAITVTTIQSELIGGDLTNGKFGSNQISVAAFGKVLPVAGQNLNIANLVATSTDADSMGARPLLAAVLAGQSYTQADVGARCLNLYNALNVYMSTFDARAMMYAFILGYGDKINKTACIGPMAPDLAAVGLQP
jgi:hypothetical protein